MDGSTNYRPVALDSLAVLRPYTRYVCACPNCGEEKWYMLSSKQVVTDLGDIDNMVCAACNFEIEFVGKGSNSPQSAAL